MYTLGLGLKLFLQLKLISRYTMPAETKHKILIVEDDEFIRSFVTIHLEHKGFDVSGVATGKAFFAAMEKEQVDLIILDLNLPDGDGLEFATEFRKTSNIPIIIASVRKSIDDRLTALNLGSIDYVTKPFDQRELFLRIRNLLNIAAPNMEAPMVESSTTPPAKNYLAVAAASALLAIVIAGVGYYLGRATPPIVTVKSAENKNAAAKQEITPPASPAVQKPPQISPVITAPVKKEQPREKAELKQIAKVPPTPKKPKAEPKCDRLPEVKWWRNKSHLAIQIYVKRKYAGNWEPYIKSWNRRREKLVDILERNSSAVSSSGVVIAGEDLEDYIMKVEKRILILKCLANIETKS